MAKKIDVRAAASSAAANPQAQANPSRFERVGRVLESRPTPVDDVAPVAPAKGAVSAGAKLAASPEALVSKVPSDTVADPVFEVWDIERIDDNVYNARHIYRPEVIKERALSIAENGQMVPGIAVRRGDRVMLIAGHYRKRALLSLGQSRMKLMVYEGLSDRQIYTMSYRENDQKADQTALDNALAWQKLLDQKVYASDEEIAADVGLSKPTVFKTLSILRLAAPVLEVVRGSPQRFALTTLYELLLLQKIGGDVVTMEMAYKVVDEGASRAEIADRRARLEAQAQIQAQQNEGAGKGEGAPPKPTRTNRRARLYPVWSHNNGREVANIREWDNGKVVFETSIPDPVARARLMEALKSLPVEEMEGGAEGRSAQAVRHQTEDGTDPVES